VASVETLFSTLSMQSKFNITNCGPIFVDLFNYIYNELLPWVKFSGLDSNPVSKVTFISAKRSSQKTMPLGQDNEEQVLRYI